MILDVIIKLIIFSDRQEKITDFLLDHLGFSNRFLTINFICNTNSLYIATVKIPENVKTGQLQVHIVNAETSPNIAAYEFLICGKLACITKLNTTEYFHEQREIVKYINLKRQDRLLLS